MSFLRSAQPILLTGGLFLTALVLAAACSDSDDTSDGFAGPGDGDMGTEVITDAGTGAGGDTGIGDTGTGAGGDTGIGDSGTGAGGDTGIGDSGTGAGGDTGTGGEGTDTPSLPDDDSLEISGTIPNYDGPGGTLGEFGRNIDVSFGELDADGSFTVTLISGAELAEELQPVAPTAAGSDGTRAFLCRGELLEVLPDDARFFVHGRLLYNRTESDGNIIVRTVELSTRTEGDSRSSNGLPNGYGDEYVMWLYSNQTLSVDVSCGDRIVDLDLQAGWNEIQVDYRSNGNERMYTGDRPDNVDWYIDPGF